MDSYLADRSKTTVQLYNLFVEKMTTERIFDIRFYSIHDGPGIRTTVFFKGCPLSCAWCHNPESQSFQPELYFHPNRCVNCGACALVCPEHAITQQDGKWVTDRSKCNVCGECVVVCYADARQIIGNGYTVEDAMAKIDADAEFYRQSGGGVTFSGGEPLSHLPALVPLMQYCKQKGYHTALDTSGCAPWSSFEQVLPYTDLVLYDLKLRDNDLHLQYTGQSNKLILENLQRLASLNMPLWIRIPVIPGINDDDHNMKETADLLKPLNVPLEVQLLAYHRVAESKYANLGKEFLLSDTQAPTPESMKSIAAIFEEAGLPVRQGG